jgi:hypothetical protein
MEDVACARRRRRVMFEGPAQVALFSLVIYVLTFLVTTMLHELAHAITSVALGGRPTLHHVFVRHRGLSGGPRALVAGAGPIFSLIQGLACVAALPYAGGEPSAAGLALLWLALHGLVNFFGYLITTPFVPSGDLGKVAAYLGLTSAGRWGLFVAGLLATAWIGEWAAEPLLGFVVDPAATLDAGARTTHVLAIGVAPWIVGSVVIGAASRPAPHWISYVYPASAGFFLLVTLGRVRELMPAPPAAPLWIDAPLWPWLLALAGVLVIFRRLLVPGVDLRRGPR